MALLSGYMRRQRHRVLKPHLRGDVLDLGCGRGTTISLLRPDQRYVGVERYLSHVETLQKRYPDREFYCRDLDRDQLDLGDRKFDSIVALAVLEHLERPKQLLSQLYSLARPKGRLLVTTPSPFGDQVLRIGARVGLFHRTSIVDHLAVYGKAQIESLLRDTGFYLMERYLFLLGANQLLICGRQ